MRVLLIEDEPELHQALGDEAANLGIQVDVASNAEEAASLLQNDAYDLVICDLKLPASAAAPEPHKEHGIRAFDLARSSAPGVPVLVFSAFADMVDLGDRFADAPPQDLYGRGPERMAMHRTKSQLPEVIECMREQRDALDALDREVEISGAQARAMMGDLDVRLISIYARKHGGNSAKVRPLTAGKSGALALRVDVDKSDGTPAGRVVAKLNVLDEIEDEERRYESYVSPLLVAGTYTNRLETLRAGARNRGGLFYALAEPYDASLFDLLREDPAKAGAAVVVVRDYLRPWHGMAPVEERTVGEIRRLLVRDERLPELPDGCDWVGLPLESQAVSARIAPSHGDLHGGNILVAADGRPILIDFGRVGPAPTALDPVTLELSAVLHPDARLALSGWPSVEQAEKWNDRGAYLEGCPIAEFVCACRDWADEVSRGDREVDAAVYAFGLRQLLFDDVDREVAAAYSRGAAARISPS